MVYFFFVSFHLKFIFITFFFLVIFFFFSLCIYDFVECFPLCLALCFVRTFIFCDLISLSILVFDFCFAFAFDLISFGIRTKSVLAFIIRSFYVSFFYLVRSDSFYFAWCHCHSICPAFIPFFPFTYWYFM